MGHPPAEGFGRFMLIFWQLLSINWHLSDVDFANIFFNQSFSTFNRPIWLYNSSINFSGSCFFLSFAVEKTSGKAVKASFFQRMIWALWTSNFEDKAGRAAVFKESNPSFARLGDYTEECTEMIKPWEHPDKLWPIYGVNNKDGVFLSTKQETAKFNAAYKRIEKDWFFHNPTRANVGSLGIVPDVPDDAITSPEYQVWKLTGGFEPEFMDLLIANPVFPDTRQFQSCWWGQTANVLRQSGRNPSSYGQPRYSERIHKAQGDN